MLRSFGNSLLGKRVAIATLALALAVGMVPVSTSEARDVENLAGGGAFK